MKGDADMVCPFCGAALTEADVVTERCKHGVIFEGACPNCLHEIRYTKDYEEELQYGLD